MPSLVIPLFDKATCKVNPTKVTYTGHDINNTKGSAMNACVPYNCKRLQDIYVLLLVYDLNKKYITSVCFETPRACEYCRACLFVPIIPRHEFVQIIELPLSPIRTNFNLGTDCSRPRGHTTGYFKTTQGQ